MKIKQILYFIVSFAAIAIFCYLLYLGSLMWLVRSIDGNSNSPYHYRKLKFEYYYETGEKNISHKIGDNMYGTIIKDYVDSIGVYDSLLYGRMVGNYDSLPNGLVSYRYFIIDARNDSVHYFTHKDSLLSNGIKQIKFEIP